MSVFGKDEAFVKDWLVRQGLEKLVALLSRSRGRGISVPRGDPRAFDTRVFEGWMSVFGKDEAFVKDWLVRQGLEKLVDFKVCFLNFRYFFITCKHTKYHKAITDVNTA